MNLRTPLTIVLAAATLAAPLKADISGPYLAARQASISADFEEAVGYYTRAVAADPANLPLLENAIIANLAAGGAERAVNLSERFIEKGGSNPIVTLVRNIGALKKGDYAPALNTDPGSEGLAPLLDGLLRGWALLGQGNMSEATAAFGEVASIPDFATLAYYHEALALALVGDFEGADEIMSGERHGPLTMSARGILSHAQVLLQLERTDDALELLKAASQGGFNPELEALAARLEAGEEATYDFVTNPEEGAAEVLFTMGAILQGRAAAEHVLVYSRLASYLREDHAQSALMTAELLDSLEQYKLAEEAFQQILPSHPTFYLAELGRASALYADGREDTAIEVLSALSKTNAERPRIHAALGDFLGRQDRDAEAIDAYTASLNLRAAGDRAAWRVYYARGIVHERIGNYEEMEADFRKALELQPNQPDVLNYLGYSLVEQRRKLDEALGMIETAVAERPESGYITDSLGWVFYRLGRYEDAVEPMERAVELLPVDPIVNDHLGDVYWKVGRFREAEFQWKRALSFEPEEEEEQRIRRKLEVGLDVVLEEEAEAKAE